MTSIWNKNISLFKARFPALFEILDCPQNPDQAFSFYDFSLSKSGGVTAQEGGLFLHSAYNPKREAENAAKALETCQKEILVFAAMGLGYLAVECARLFPQKTFVVIEPDAMHFFAALSSIDFEPVFKIQKLFFLIGSSVKDAEAVIESSGGFENAKILFQKPQILHAEKWFEDFFSAAKGHKAKASINTATLERFGLLWLKNSSRNLGQMQALDGVGIYFKKTDIPSVLLAAGPSLNDALPFLKQIQERAITICVDTALRAVLGAGVEPDFIVLTDPQYYAAMHIMGLKSFSSVLVTESAAYPAVFRFKCKKIVLASSLFPLGKFIEGRLGKKGELSSGGSVSTSAWDLARAIGSKEIFCAGLDLSFPKSQTHIRGSTFERLSHTKSTRQENAETQNARLLFSAKNQKGLDYDGNEVVTDERMRLFAWWFEKNLFTQNGVTTYTFSRKGLFIKGLEYFPIEKFLLREKVLEKKKNFFARSEQGHSCYNKKQFEEVLGGLRLQFKKLLSLSKEGIAKCNDILVGHPRANEILKSLSFIDGQILSSDAKAVASLVFPTQRQLEEIFLQKKFSADPVKNSAEHSKIIYEQLQKAIGLVQL